MLDRSYFFSKELIPLMTETVDQEFHDHWTSCFGMPYCAITDQGDQFRSKPFKNIGATYRFKIYTTIVYHPQYNGKIERVHCILKVAIAAQNSVKWIQTLSTVLLG